SGLGSMSDPSQTYKVVVTDAMGEVVSSIATVYDEDLYTYSAEVIGGYLEGESTIVRISLSTGTVTQVYMNGQTQPFTPSGDGILLSVPSTWNGAWIHASVLGYICEAGAEWTVPPPTTLPEMTVVEVNGSCSNANTGSVTVALGEGSIP